MSLRPTQRTSNTPVLALAMGLAVVLHVPLLAFIALWGPESAGMPRLRATPKQSNAEFSVRVVSQAPKKEKAKEQQEDEPAQFVTAPLPDVVEVPEKARFLDRVSSSTERETVRRALPGAKAQPTASTSPGPPKKKSGETATQNQPASTDATTKSGLEEEPGLNGRVAERQASDVPLREAEPMLNAGGGDPLARIALPNFSNTRITAPNGEDGSIDYLRDVDEGDKTLLNRKESRYAAFFDRVKLQIKDEWSPVSEYRKRDPYGNVFGVKDRYSQVRVTLNGDGTVRQLYMARPSGLEFFDDEAVRSIRAAAPFHNPPEGLKDDDGLVHFTFGFYFEVSAGPSMRMFR
ncbi:MAG: TonB family protein [bacterium]